jgi:predicted small lipoprotein YifL
LARFALLTALAAALTLAACGRKGPLDPPPVAAVPAGEPGAAPAAGEISYGPDGQPIAPRGPRKPIFLDWLLD